MVRKRKKGLLGRRGRRFSRLRGPKKLLFYLLLASIVVVPVYVYYLDYKIGKQFEGKRWALPARVYARPLEIFPGKALTPDQFEVELRLLGYRYGPKLQAGHYFRRGNGFEVVTRSFDFGDIQEQSTHFKARFSRIGVSRLEHAESGKKLTMVRFDPVMVGSIYPSHKEDRILVQLDEVPPVLIQALIAVEDKNFYTHLGIDPKGILRALWANVRARGMVQGGSTLTQQLVKNFFLTSERTLWRKGNEAIMALLLESHYEKQDILQAYCNEIYLGQDGERAIHGFGLASWFYYQRPLMELKVSEVSLLVGMVRGPSFYDPRRHPDRARERRNHVINSLLEAGALDEEEADLAKAASLDLNARQSGSKSNYPAFIDLVRRQLRRDYREQDLNSEGLQIFTTMDPIVQAHAEKAVENTLKSLEKGYRFTENSLESAAVVSSVQGGEVLAIVGSRKPRYAGFNRALDAVRQVGSLIKPAVYLSALEQPSKYTLSTLLDDGPLEWEMRGGKVWSPDNYDKEFHGMVSLQKALAKSYNVATARLGLSVGVERVLDTVQRLGIVRELNPYPSLFLGAASLSPFDVTQMYQTMAGGGYQTPLRAIRSVLTAKGNVLQRYELSLERKFEPAPIYLISRALQRTVEAGTGQLLKKTLPAKYKIAGKTGTTDDLRDSWFAGFTGNYVAAVWVGRDDNKSAGLTGATGALRVWANLFAGLNIQALDLSRPDNVGEQWVDEPTNRLVKSSCRHAIKTPYIAGSAPTQRSSCSGGVKSWMRRVFD